MKNLFLIPLFILLFGIQNISFAQDDKVPSTFMLGLEQDNIYGFYPNAFGTIGLNDKLSLAFYGLFWTTGSSADNLLLEVGGGVSFPSNNGKWLFNTYLGFTNGRFYSPSSTVQFGEAVVPNAFAFYFGERFESEFFAAFYQGIRNTHTSSVNTQNNAIIWAYQGYIINDNISAGLHYENSSNTDGYVFYRHLGPYIKLNIDQKYVFRFAFGKNFKTEFNPSEEYYKLSVFSFLK